MFASDWSGFRSPSPRLAVGGLLVCMLSLVACSDNKGDSAAELGTGTSEPAATQVESSSCGEPDILCVGAVVAPGGVPLEVVNAALVMASDESGALIEMVEAANASEFELLIGTMVDREVDLVIVAGGGAGDAAIDAGERHQDLSMISLAPIDGAHSDNVSSLATSDAEAGFMAGALAGLTSTAGKVGAILASDEDPATASYRQGWEAGARFINPDIELFTTFHPGELAASFDDPAWAVGAARDLAAQGVDVVSGWGGTTGAAALVELAKSDGAIACVGVGENQWDATVEAQPCLVASVVSSVGLDAMLANAIAVFGASGSVPDLSETAAGFNIVGLQAGGVSGELIGQLDEIKAGIVDGSVSVR